MRLPAIAFLMSCTAAVAQETQAPPPYMDDRSDAAELVRSLYNAVNRKEYARAWSYFGDRKPAKDLEEFAKGYQDTERVDVATGGVTEEGAAGSFFSSVPVAIRATNADGSQHIFAGCYTARLADPQIQGSDFKPLQLERETLKPAKGSLVEALPDNCGDGRKPASRDAELRSAVKRFAVELSWDVFTAP